MRITSIELAGSQTRDGKGMPRAFARIGRRLGDDHITVEILGPHHETTHHLSLDNDKELLVMARALQHILDGYQGTNSEVHGYYAELLRLSDL